MIKMVDLHKQDGCIRNDIDKAIADAVDECAFIKGAEVGTFEAELAHYVNAKYVSVAAMARMRLHWL